MQQNPQHDAHVPNGMRAAAAVVKPVPMARFAEDAFGKMCCVEDQAGAISDQG